MNNAFSRRFLLCILPVLWLASPATAANFLVQITPPGSITAVCANYGLTLLNSVSASNTVFLVSAPDPVSTALVAQIQADPSVATFEPDTPVVWTEIPAGAAAVTSPAALQSAILDTNVIQYYGAPVRESYVLQPAASLANIAPAQGFLRSPAPPGIVAVIDTGVDPGHPALQGVLLPGYDFTRNQPGASELADLSQSTVAILDQSTVAILDQSTVAILDQIYSLVLNQSTVAILDQSTVAILDGTQLPSDFGHGTMVAGLIHLVAPTAPILPLKAFSADGSANLSNIVSAIYYAVDNNAKVINMSFSSPLSSPSLAGAIQYARNNNVICVASAGNDGLNEVVYPAAYQGVIGVTSTNLLDQRSLFSNYASFDLAAPGEALVTTYPGGHYAGVWGTSFSTALASGTVALLSEVYPGIHQGTAQRALQSGPNVPIDDFSMDANDCRLDVLAALMYLFEDH